MLCSETPELDTNCKIVWCKLNIIGCRTLYLGSFYRPPDKIDNEYLEEFNSSLSRIISNRNAHVLVGGDFNCGDIEWSHMQVPHGVQKRQSQQQLLDIIGEHCLTQVVNIPTRNDRTLDLLFTNAPSPVNRGKGMPPIGKADHDIVYVEYDIKAKRIEQASRKIYLYKRADMVGLKEHVAQFKDAYLSEDHSHMPVNDMWVKFKTGFVEAVERFIPSKMTKTKYSVPWIDATIKRLVKKRHKLYLRARKSKDPDVKIHNKRFRAHVQKVLRDAYWKYVSNIFTFENDSSDPDTLKPEKIKKFWSFVKSLKKDAYGITSLRENGILKTDSNANVSPVFKKGEKYDAANYRPASLTCICCKTLEHILVSNINKHLALDSILADCQHGFRSQRSCETQLVQFVHDIISNLDGAVNRGHKQTDLIIMDFAKAFDKVPHRRLLHKLENYGIRGSTHKWINSWLSGRTEQVVLDGQASDPVPVLSGVPQGSVLGPVLFLLFINDLPDNIRSSFRLFAVDCVLYRNIHTLQDCLTLQWEADWQMKFNVAKCHSMRVTRHQHHKQILFDYSLHNQTLEIVQSAKYLGITITDNMNWGQHVSEISSKATKTLGFLRRNLAFAPRSTKEVAYKTLVRPKLEYAAPIWSPHSKLQINQIEKVQRTAARWTCRRWRNTSSVGEMLDELEWPSLEARRDQSSLLLFHKIHCGAVYIEKDKHMYDPCS